MDSDETRVGCGMMEYGMMFGCWDSRILGLLGCSTWDLSSLGLIGGRPKPV